MSLFDITNKVNETDKNINEAITENETVEQISTNTQNTENTIKEDKVQEKQIIKEETVTVDNSPTEDEETTETKQVDMQQEHSSAENNTEIVIAENETAKEGKVIDTREVDRYINALLKYGDLFDVFEISAGSRKYLLCKVSSNRKHVTRLTNALPVITKRIEYTNGLDTKSEYELVVFILDDNDKKLGPCKITDKELSKLTSTICSKFIGQVINYEANSDKKMREVVEAIGRESVEAKTVYSHTGFIEQDGKKIFLYHGGSIGTDENNKVETDLTDYNIQQYCFTDKEFELEEALKTEYSLLELGDLKVIIPMLATTFLSPLCSILQEEGILINYLLMVVGKTGTYKSSSAALMLSHFGNFEVNRMPLSFRATFCGIEQVAFSAKDILLVVDDYKPETMETDQEKTMESILGLWGDRNSRIKMNSKGGLHQKYSARGLCMVTAERPPKFSQSRLARAMTTYTQEGSINFKKLKEIHANKEQLAVTMKQYIKWIITNEEGIRKTAKELQNTYSIKTENLKVHPRIKQNIIVMMIGFTMLLDFLLENKIIDSKRKEQLQNEAYLILQEVGLNQESDVEDEDPAKVFFKTIGQLQIANKVYFADYKTGRPINDISFGTQIGYIDNENNQYYLIADTVYKEIEKACIGKFTATPKQLWKSLLDEGYLVTDKDNRKIVRRTDPSTKNKVEVIIIPKAKWIEAMGNEEILAP